MTITPEQQKAVQQAGDSPVEMYDPQTGLTYVLIRADVFLKLRQTLEDLDDRHGQEAWSKLARKSRDLWAETNSY